MADTYLSAPRSACPLWVGTGLSRALLDFNLAICYAGMKGRVRPKAEVRHCGNSRISKMPYLLGCNFSMSKCL